MVTRRSHTKHIFPALIFLAGFYLASAGSTVFAASILQQEMFKVAVSGVEGDARKNVESMLSLPHGLVRDGRVEPTWARRFARRAKERVAKAL